ncbi:unnamed protein product [Sphagnum jensenii]|uniref:C-CAP/cofactor C-like domain-containing protein n=1 Tax=Sphagnum jensenii TaxID=128206 RepID=A0ABP1B0J6_9BRYO
MGGIVSRIGRAMFRGLVRLCCYAPSPKSTLESRGPGPYLRQQRRSSICLDQQQQQQPTRCCKYQIPKCVNDPSSLCFCDLRDETHICTVQGLVEGQQAIIEDCEGCKIFIFGNCASLTLDGCSNCSVHVASIDGSVMMRNCCLCTCSFCCRQFRYTICSLTNYVLL